MASRERAIVNFANERARFYGDAGAITIYDVRAILDYYEHHCLFPGCPDIATTLDHVIPLAKRGENTRANLQPLCAKHNKQKQDQEIDYRPTNKPFCPDDYEPKEREESGEKTDRSSRDWEKIRIDYVTGEISYRDLAAKHGVSLSAVRLRAVAADWQKQRGEFRVETTTKLAQKLQEEYIDAKSTAFRVAQNVIASWLSPFGQPASASDAINAAKLLLLAEGEPTARIEYLDRLRRQVLGNELEQVLPSESPEPSSDWILATALADTDPPVP